MLGPQVARGVFAQTGFFRETRKLLLSGRTTYLHGAVHTNTSAQEAALPLRIRDTRAAATRDSAHTDGRACSGRHRRGREEVLFITTVGPGSAPGHQSEDGESSLLGLNSSAFDAPSTHGKPSRGVRLSHSSLQSEERRHLYANVDNPDDMVSDESAYYMLVQLESQHHERQEGESSPPFV